MSLTLAAVPSAAPTLSNLEAFPTIGSVALEWDAINNSAFFGAEVWRADSNDRSAATKWATVMQGNTYVDTSVEAGENYFYWIRAVDIYGRATGAWTPSSSTAGVEGITPYIQPAQVEPKTTITSASISTAASSSSYTATTYNAWEETNSWIYFQHLGTNALFNISMLLAFTNGAISGGSDGDAIALNARLRLHDVTHNEDVPGATAQFFVRQAVRLLGAWSETWTPFTAIQHQMSLGQGFLGVCQPSVEYKLFLDIKRERIGTPTFNASGRFLASTISGSAVS